MSSNTFNGDFVAVPVELWARVRESLIAGSVGFRCCSDLLEMNGMATEHSEQSDKFIQNTISSLKENGKW